MHNIYFLIFKIIIVQVSTGAIVVYKAKCKCFLFSLLSFLGEWPHYFYEKKSKIHVFLNVISPFLFHWYL